MEPHFYFVLFLLANSILTFSLSEGHRFHEFELLHYYIMKECRRAYKTLLLQADTNKSADITSRYNPDGWIDASAYLREALDMSVDPCEDFYGFVCNKWNESFGSATVFMELARVKEAVAAKLIKSLNAMNLADSRLSSYKRSLKSFYDQCMANPYADDEALILDIYQNLDKYFVPNIMVNVNGTNVNLWELKDDESFWMYIGRLQRYQNTHFIVKADVYTAVVNCTKVPVLRVTPQMTQIDRPTLDVLFRKILGQYHNITINEEDLNDTAESIFKFERDVLQLYLDSSNAEVQLKVSQLEVEFPKVSWKAYLEGLLPEEMLKKWLTTDPVIVVSGIEYFQKLNIKKYDRDTLYNFGYALVVQRYYDLFRKSKFDTSDVFISVFRQQENICLDLAFRYFSSATARLLFDVYNIDIDEWTTDLNAIAESVFSAFRYMVSSLDWVGAEDKAKLIRKVNAVQFDNGIPDWIKSDETVEAKTPRYNFSLSLMANDILTQQYLFRHEIESLLTGVFVEGLPNFYVNALYWHLNIKILLGIQMPPFYSNSYPLAVKYGTLGFVIAHELIHGFDADGIAEAPTETEKWLKESTMKQFNRKKQCLIKQYSHYCYDEHNACISGQRTINDNIADVEGLKIAFTAYKFATHTTGVEPALDDLVDYTMDQIFFISVARGWCGNEAKTAFLLEKDVHSPPRARVERSLSNFRAFAKTFNCPMGGKLAPIKTCSLWGDFWEF